MSCGISERRENMCSFEVTEYDEFAIVEVIRSMTVSEVKKWLRVGILPRVTPGLGVILSGAGPSWVIAFLSFVFRARPFVAVRVRDRKAIVVHSTDPRYCVGQFVNLPKRR